jgi:hypothetical protein
MHIGMTGARDGMTQEQKYAFEKLLCAAKAGTLHHGDCVGADADAHDLARSISLKVVVHPPEKDELRAFKEGDEMREEKGYFARNRDIVNESEALFGTPRTMLETKGGTWYTINYGKKRGKPVRIIYPDGSIEKFN